MKNIKFIYSKIILLSGLLFLVTTGCEREISDEVGFAINSESGEIFTDSPIGLGSDFYFPFGGSKATAWTVDDSEGHESEASMRFDVPNEGDPEGSYAGGIFRVDGAGRDLTGFDALTFWAKASQGVNIANIGFGVDFLEDKYESGASILLSTTWVKYIIPIPDPSRLIDERGLFTYAANTGDTGGFGYTFWIDDLKFEKLGTIGAPRPIIGDGSDIELDVFLGTTGFIQPRYVTFNLPTGKDITVGATGSYFDWTSSEPSIISIAKVGDGEYSTVSTGTSVITSSLAGVQTKGSWTITVLGEFELAPIPARDPANVTSIFSDVYDNNPVDFFNGYWEPYQTTQSSFFAIRGDNILNYTDFNFVGNQFSNPTVDASQKSNMHINMYIPEVPANMDFLITIVDFGADKAEGGGDDTREQVFFDKSLWVEKTWITLEFPITKTDKNAIGQIIYENINFSSLTTFYLDNIYFYSE